MNKKTKTLNDLILQNFDNEQRFLNNKNLKKKIYLAKLFRSTNRTFFEKHAKEKVVGTVNSRDIRLSWVITISFSLTYIAVS